MDCNAMTYRNFDPATIGLITSAISGVGGAIGGYFQSESAQTQAEIERQRAELQLIQAQEKAKSTKNVVIIILIAFSLFVLGYFIVRKTKK